MVRVLGTLAALVMACSFDASGSGSDDAASTGGTAASADSTAGAGPTSGPTGNPTGEPTGDPTGGPTSADTGSGDDATTGPVAYGPFDTPVALTELNSDGTDDDPSLRGDLLEVYFGSTRAGTEDLWRATRSSATDPFDAPEPVVSLNADDADETTPELSSDGLTLMFSSSRAGGLGDLDMYVTTRAGLDDDWGEPVAIAELSSEFGEGAAVFTDDALLAVFCRGQVRGNAAIFRGTRPDEGNPWEVERLESLETPASECSPWITADGSELWFASTREGGAGGNDVWLAIMDGGDPGSPEPVVELNTEVEDDDPWLSPDGSTIVFASDRDEAGDVDLFIAVRTAR